MRPYRFCSFIFAACLAAGLLPGVPVADAACNARPSIDSLAGKAPPPAKQLEAGLLPYRGALGRIDRVDFSPTEVDETGDASDSVITLGPDGCGSGVFSPEHSKDDLIVTFVFEEEADRNRPRVLQLAAPHQHAALAMLGLAAAKQGFVFNGVFPNDGVAVVSSTVAGVEELRLRVRMPTPQQIGPAETVAQPHFQDTRVIVTKRDATPPLVDLVSKNCAAFAFAKSNKPLACIDSMYSSVASPCAVNALAKDPLSCHAGTAWGMRNKFAKQCFPKDPPAPTPKKCKGEPTELYYVADQCGNIRMRYRWKEVVPDDQKRDVRGFSGISQSTAGINERIFIPGSEFLASTRNRDSGGNPWKPDFKAHPNSTLESGMDLSGAADETRSTLWLFPRMPASFVCAGTVPEEACMGIVDDEQACYCKTWPNCACNKEGPPKYFACSGDPKHEYQPCTNSTHCGTGTCNRQARCVDKMSVWDPQEAPQGNVCTGDGTAGGCATDQGQCGYSLFEHRHQADLGVLKTVPFVLDSSGAHRGVCEYAPTRTCGVEGTDGCADDYGNTFGRCIGYYLTAGDVHP